MLHGYAHCEMLFEKGEPRDFVYIDVNPLFEELTGLKDVVGRRVTEVIPGIWESDPELFQTYRRVAETGNPERFETYVESLGVWFSISAYSPEKGHFVALFDNITERKRAEEALKAAEQRFRSLIEGSRDTIGVMEPGGTIRFVSAEVERLSGYRPEEITGQNAFAFVHPDDLPRLQARLEEILQGAVGPGPMPIPFRFRHRDGSWRFLEVVANNRVADLAVGGLVVNVRDVTERREAEESVQKLLSAVEQGGDAIFITDPDGAITYVNPAFERVYGFSKKETLGKTPQILRSGRYDEVFYERFWKTLLAGKTVRGEIVSRRRDGRLVTVEGSISPVLDAEGGRIGFVCVQNDVSEKKLLEEQLRQAQKMEAIGQLAGGVAHDFNNLLTTILGYSDLVLSRISEAHPIREDLEEIRRAGERAASLTRQLLAFSRRQVLEPKVLDLNVLVRDLQKMLRRLIGEDVDLVTALGEAIGPVRADPGQIEQVVLNLAVNARDAMPRGGILTIETADVELDESYALEHAPVQSGSYVMLAVADTGTGMSAETKSHMFEPFFTTKGKGKGTGLGLATVYGIVKQSGGYIWVYSELGRGTTFKIYLPRIDGSAEEAKRRSAAVRPAGGSETVLLVEDEEAVRALSRSILESYGYRVLEAEGPHAAMEMAQRHETPIQLILTDVVMPDMDGADLVSRLAPLHPEAKVLFMSGYTDDAVVRHGMITEGGHFLQKPFTPASLAAKVREVLDATS